MRLSWAVIFAMWYQRERADDRRRLQKRLRAQRLEHPSEPSISDDA